MWRIRKPSVTQIREFIDWQAGLEMTYKPVGATAGKSPPGYLQSRTRIKLGEGEETFVAAKSALRNWAQFQLGWIELCWSDVPIEPGRVVAVLAHVLGIWSLNACRIVYVVDEAGTSSRFGLAYGTLPAHAESGEELFLVEWNRHDNAVWYDLSSFSRPNELLARLGHPYVRRKQRQFQRDSAQAMVRAVASLRA
jgi:uncharacterized protein (UPF0548 family)